MALPPERAAPVAGDSSPQPGDRPVGPAERPSVRLNRPSVPGHPHRPLPGDRAPLTGDRAPLTGDRAPLPGDRAPLPVDRPPLPGDRAPLPGDRAPLPGDRAPLPGDRAPLPGDRAPLPGDRAPLPGDRAPLPGDRHPLPGDRAPLPGPLRCLLAESVDDAEGLCVAVERCPLCGTSRRRLTCARCVQTGDFVHLNARGTERYSEKVERLKKLREEKDALLRRVIEAMDKKIHADERKWKVMSSRGRIQQLKEAVTLSNQQLKSDLDLLSRSHEEVQRLQRRAGRHQEKRDKIERHNKRLSDLKEKRSKDLSSRLEQLSQARRTHIQELTGHIFSLQEDKVSSREEDSAGTVSELAEARRTTYLSGRWIWDDQNGDSSISITCPSVHLPSNGDCSAYYSPGPAPAAAGPAPAAPEPELELNPVHTISAALCYTTQLTSILAHILDTTLPHKLCHSEFCGENLSRYRFTRALNKLNTNVLHLCFSQLVDSEKLHPHHTLRNLMFLVSPANQHLGRTGPFSAYGGLEESLEFLEPDGGPQDESEEETVTDEETDLGTDWETVPSPRFCDIPSQPMDVSSAAAAALHVSQPSAQAGGMISSAAASVTSWFRAYTGQR